MMMMRWWGVMGKGEGRGSPKAWEKVGKGIEGREERRERTKEV